MSIQKRWGLFTYLAVDRRAAQTYLDEMARQGWALERVWLGLLARFHRTERTDLTYFIDWAAVRREESAAAQAACAEAGWLPVQSVGALDIYASRPGRAARPLQQDGAWELHRFRRRYLKRQLFWVLLILLEVLLQGPRSAGTGSFLASAASLNFFAYFHFALPALIIACLPFAGYLCCRLVSWRRAAATGVPIPVPTPRAARLWSLTALPATLWTALLLALLPLDLSLNDQGWFLFVLFALLPAGFLVGALLRRDPRRRGSVLGTAALLLALLLTGLAGRLWFSQPLQGLLVPPPPAPIQEEGLADVFVDEHNLLLSYRWFFEYEGGDRDVILTNVMCCNCRFPLTAAGAVRVLREGGMEPLEGVEGVWRSPPEEASGGQTLLVRNGGRVVRLTGPGDRDPYEWSDWVLAWMATWP